MVDIGRSEVRGAKDAEEGGVDGCVERSGLWCTVSSVAFCVDFVVKEVEGRMNECLSTDLYTFSEPLGRGRTLGYSDWKSEQYSHPPN